MWDIVLVGALSIFTISSALCVILQKNPIVCAVFLIATFLGLGGLYLGLQSPFVAAIQILVYAGAITVLFIFVIMLLNLKTDVQRFPKFRISRFPRLAAIFLLFWCIYTFVHLTAFPIAISDEKNAFAVSKIAEILFSKYLFAFELASFLLLIAMVGGVVMAKKRLLP